MFGTNTCYRLTVQRVTERSLIRVARRALVGVGGRQVAISPGTRGSHAHTGPPRASRAPGMSPDRAPHQTQLNENSQHIL
jgi:hypothetical protein